MGLRTTASRTFVVRRNPAQIMLVCVVLGIESRLWMRFISDEAEFTWGGTAIVVSIFPLFGIGHVIAAAARRRGRLASVCGRLAGLILTLPLFGAAGAMMLPSVMFGSLATWRVTWSNPVRVGCGVLAAVIPTYVVVDVLITALSVQRVVGVLMFVISYTAVILLTGPMTSGDWVVSNASAERMSASAR